MVAPLSAEAEFVASSFMFQAREVICASRLLKKIRVSPNVAWSENSVGGSNSLRENHIDLIECLFHDAGNRKN